MTHTPGPFVENGESNWHPDLYEGRGDTAWAVIRSDSADYDVAIVMTDSHYDDPVFDANVRLFCAAPDLLAALVALVPADFAEHPSDFAEEWHVAYRAIARATTASKEGE